MPQRSEETGYTPCIRGAHAPPPVGRLLGRWGAVLLPLVALGCWNPQDERARAVIRFQEPERVLVQDGDTLQSLARDHNVSADEIVAWNEGVTIEPGSVLLIWPNELLLPSFPAEGDPAITTGSKRPSARGRPVAARQGPSSAPSPGGLGPDDRPRSVRTAGIFGADLEMDDGTDGLADAVAGLDGSRGSYGNAGLRTGTDMRTTNAEQSADLAVRPAPHNTGPSVASGPVTVPRLTMPAAKRCKVLGTRNTGEDGMYGGEGLSSAAIKAALQTTLGTSRKCMPAGTRGKFSMIIELTVGCDGRVKNAFTINGGGLPGPVTDCIEKVLAHTAFPAHDIPDGQSFQYPINYAF